jgi:putative protease
LNDRQDKIGSIETPKMKGQYIGDVTDVRNRTIIINTQEKLLPGDGLCWLSTNGKLEGTSVNKVIDHKVILQETKKIRIGAEIYRNHDHAFYKSVNKNPPKRKIKVRLSLRDFDQGYTLTATDSDNIAAAVSLETVKQFAQNAKLAQKVINRQLSKTGNTIYQCISVTIDCDVMPFLPLSELNRLRRQVLEKLTTLRLLNRPVQQKKHDTVETAMYPNSELTYKHNVLNTYAASYLTKHGVKTIQPAVESGLSMHNKTVMRTRYCLKREMDWCPKKHNNIYEQRTLFLKDIEGHKYRLIFDCSECEMEIVY